MRTELGSWRRAWRRVGKAEVEVQTWSRRHWRRRWRMRRRRRRRTTALIKSNNPHLAGGEKAADGVKSPELLIIFYMLLSIYRGYTHTHIYIYIPSLFLVHCYVDSPSFPFNSFSNGVKFSPFKLVQVIITIIILTIW